MTTKPEWIEKIGELVTDAGAELEAPSRALLARMTERELATVHLLLALVGDPVARRYQKQKHLLIPKARDRVGFVIRYDSSDGKTSSYFACMTAIGPRFGEDLQGTQHFSDAGSAEMIVARFTPLASVCCTVERAVLDQATGTWRSVPGRPATKPRKKTSTRGRGR